MASWIQLPDGYTFALENMASITAVGPLVVFKDVGGAMYEWPAGHQLYAANVVTAVQAIMFAPATYTVLAPAPVITSVVPDNEDITLCTNTISNGYGFTPGTVGTLYVGNSGNGTDNAGLSLTCTFISATQLKAVYAGVGDAPLGGVGGSVNLYYLDTAGHYSNILLGTNPSGTLVTIP